MKRPKKYLLIANDNADIQLITGMLIDERDAEIRIKSVNRLSDGIRYLSNAGVDVVILDVKLDDMNGVDVLKEIIKMPGLPPEVIMISGHSNIEIAVNSTKIGAYDFIEKPFSIEKLLISLRNALERREFERKVIVFNQMKKEEVEIIEDFI